MSDSTREEAGLELGPVQAPLAALSGFLSRLEPSVRFVDYRAAERDCERLAAGLRSLIPAEDLRDFRLAAIPRGGLIVLGMLSYFLDLESEQLEGGGDTDRPLILVDDCSLTGYCFALALRRVASRRVVFAHLYSHPELRSSILARESRVVECVAARDLRDLSGELFGDESARREWREDWLERLGPDRYWYGVPEIVGFAWSEPDRLWWNRELKRVEPSWRFLPPHLCLKNRSFAAPRENPSDRQWRVARGVVWGSFEEEIWLCHTPSEEVFSLVGAGADIWRLLSAYGRSDDVVDSMERLYDVGRDRLQSDVEQMARRLVKRSLLEPAVKWRRRG